MSRLTGRAKSRPKSAAMALLAAVSALTACDMPDYEGPQLQEPPQGFRLQPTARPGRSMFQHLPEVYRDAWVQSIPPHSTITITGYAGALTLEDAMAAQDSGRLYAEDPEIVFGGLEPLDIDGREAWGWEERIETPTRGIPWVAYRAMVPYDTVTYAIEFSTEDPTYKSTAPASTRAMVSTFAVGETVYNWPLIILGAGLLLFAVHMLRQRSQAKAARLQSINLVQVEKKEEAAEEPGELAAAVGGRSGPPPLPE